MELLVPRATKPIEHRGFTKKMIAAVVLNGMAESLLQVGALPPRSLMP